MSNVGQERGESGSAWLRAWHQRLGDRRWRDKLIEHSADVFGTRASDDADQCLIAERERLLGRRTVELEVAKEYRSG